MEKDKSISEILSSPSRPKIRRKTKVIGISLNDMHIGYINRLIEQKGYLSVSEAVRRSIELLYEKTFPDYIYNKSAADLLRRRSVENEELLKEMDDMKFAESFIPGGLFVKDKYGNNYYLIHAIANMLQPIPMGEIRDFVKNEGSAISIHKDALNDSTVISKLDDYMIQFLNNEYGIVIDKNGKQELSQE